MKNIKREQLVPALVKEVEITSTHPGYRYVYFTSFNELDQYFRELCGDDWKEQEWAKFWLRDHWRTLKQESKPMPVAKSKKTKDGVKIKYPKRLVKALAEHYVKECNLSLRETARALREKDGIALDHSTIAKLLKED